MNESRFSSNDNLNQGSSEKNLPKAESHSSELWYHQGPPDLLPARIWIAYFSLNKVQDRLDREKTKLSEPEFKRAAKSQELQRRYRDFQYKSSQVGDDRPLTYCSIAPDNRSLATASRSGMCKLWNIDSLECLRSFKGHGEHAGSIIYHPLYDSNSDSSIHLASCCSSGLVFLWNTHKEDPIYKLPNHGNRVTRLAFHPSGRFLGSTCFDNSWRLFDLEKGVEVLHQEGHSRECFNLVFHPDGSLAVSAGFDARALVWDLRTGRCILPLDGHLKKVVALDIAQDGFYIATGSEDQKTNIWDLRMQKLHHTIASHTNLISHVKFGDGCLITSSFDKTCRIWSHPGWFPLKTLTGHDQKLSCVDISSDQSTIITTSFDRTFKVWK